MIGNRSGQQIAKVVWVFGNSAVGKQTFIEECIAGNNIVKKLGWGDKTLYCPPSSMSVLGGSENVMQREKIIDECRVAVGTHDIVLIKWQYEDSESGLIARLRHALPKARHMVIWLKAPNYESQRARLVQKAWWKDGEDRQREFVAAEDTKVAESVKRAEELLETNAMTVISLEGRRYELR